MHSRTADTLLGLRHKACEKSVPFGNCSNSQLKSHDIVRRGQCLVIFKVDLMLSRCHLVMGRLNLKSHILQSQHHISSCILPQIHRTQVKISRLFMSDGSRLAVVILMQQKKFTFRANIEAVPHLGCLIDLLLEYHAGCPCKRCSVRIVHVTDNAGYLALLWPPWENRKGVQIRIQIHVGLLDAHKALDRRSVKHNTVI